jgi:glycerophosphoryl diester phosphodiesterase
MTGPRTRRPLLLGHRGARAVKSIPENTIASFDRALADGCDGFEFDVRLTADGQAVIFHDPQYDGIEIARASAQQLTALPHLQDVLVRYRDQAFFDIELKVAGLEQITVDLLRRHPVRHGFVVSSFLPEVLRTVHAKDSEIPLGLICETKDELRRWTELPVEFVVPHHTLITPTLISQLKAVRKKIIIWTVNTAVSMRRFAGYEVDGIISDNTSLLCRTLSVE